MGVRGGGNGTGFEQVVAQAVSRFGAEVTPKLKGGGWPEDQLRGPLENLFHAACHGLGLTVTLTGEVPLIDLDARPDYAVTVGGACIGYVELKRPGTTADPLNFTGRNAAQWKKLARLPNVLLCDGNEFSLHQNGEQVGDVVRLRGSVRTSGSRLAPSDGRLARVLHDFLTWAPQAPRSARQLVRSVAGLCRLLSDEVAEAIVQEKAHERPPTFTEVAEEWRDLLFPETTDVEFVEQYGQVVVFALLLARVEGIVFEGDNVHGIATKLGKKHSLMGKALEVLTADSATALSTTLETLLRVVGAVDWDRLDDGTGDAYFLLYEHFLQLYDADLRMRTGSYYTPHGVVSAMVRLTEGILTRDFGLPEGFASQDLVVVDPAMGTGTFLLYVLERAAGAIAEREGPGAVGPRLREMVGERLVGFEMQTGPFAVAELRMHAMLKRYGSAAPARGMRLLVADALDSPTAEFNRIPHTYRALAESRRQANSVKRDQRVMVVLGNPPHDAVGRGAGKWVERGDPGALEPPPIDAFRIPGNGRYESKMSNLYVYFWRWATWKVFDAHQDAPFGVVALITPKAWLKSRAFAGMRRYLRSRADEGWIVDLSPEGHRPDVSTRIFPGVAQQLCIAVFVRRSQRTSSPATVRHIQLFGRREEKIEQLQTLTLDDPRWRECAQGSTDPFLPPSSNLWSCSPSLDDLMPWSSRGVTPGRTWVYAPDEDTLRRRWRRFLAADAERRRELLGEARDRTIDSLVEPLPGIHGYDRTPLREERRDQLTPVRVAYRSFDRQLIMPDHRLMVVARPDLWRVRSDRQIYTVEQNAHPVTSGPGLVFSALIPDMDYFNGRSGCVRPLFRDAESQHPNIAPALLALLSRQFGMSVSPEDLLAYIAAVTAHPGYTDRFREDLEDPGARIPLTGESALWQRGVDIGRRILWAHTYGERYVDPENGRPAGAPRLTVDRPQCVEEIPDDEASMPQQMIYDPVAQDLWVGEGRISLVPSQVREYAVSGMNVLDKWFGYRRKLPAGKRRLDLDLVVAQRWTPDRTTELLDLLNVLGTLVKEEPHQATLLDEICSGRLITRADLAAATILPVSPGFRRPVKGGEVQEPPLFEW